MLKIKNKNELRERKIFPILLSKLSKNYFSFCSLLVLSMAATPSLKRKLPILYFFFYTASLNTKMKASPPFVPLPTCAICKESQLLVFGFCFSLLHSTNHYMHLMNFTSVT